jgi:hypothetical protein
VHERDYDCVRAIPWAWAALSICATSTDSRSRNRAFSSTAIPYARASRSRADSLLRSWAAVCTRRRKQSWRQRVETAL